MAHTDERRIVGAMIAVPAHTPRGSAPLSPARRSFRVQDRPKQH
jgi:hypothetical protein